MEHRRRIRDARDRIDALLEAARSVVADATLVPALVESTGLSAQGVELGLWHYLELSPSESELSTLVETSIAASHVHVILAANVFVAALRSLAVACAASASVTVKPSRRDPVLARALVRAAPSLDIEIVESLSVDHLAHMSQAEAHVYGSDETAVAVRASLPRDVLVRAHGTGLGVAVVTSDGSLEEAAQGLAADTVVFDQRGCLSPRIVIVLGDRSRAEAFVRALADQLTQHGRVIPRGNLTPEEKAAAARYAETMRFMGEVVRGDDFAVALGADEGPLVVPPPGRHLTVAVARDLDAAKRLLAPLRAFIVALGTDDARVGKGVVTGARVRVSALGQMQKPPFDGPVDLRAI